MGSESLHAQQTESTEAVVDRMPAVRRGVRVAAMIGAVQLGAYMIIVAASPLDLSVFGIRPTYAMLMAMMALFALAAIRPGELLGSSRMAAVQATLLPTVTLVIIGLVAPAQAQGHLFTHVALTHVLLGSALLIPMPPRISVLSLSTIALAYPLTQLIAFGNQNEALLNGLLFVDCAAALAMAITVSYVHNELFMGAARARGALFRVAETDPLTGVLNRRSVELRARDALYDTAMGHRPGLVIVDLDCFKAINTTHGYAIGDEVLSTVGRRLNALRDANPDLHVGRIGGEEFMVVVPTGGRSRCQTIADQVRAALQPVVSTDTTNIAVTASVGWASTEQVATRHYPVLFATADAAMYEAKSSGGNCSAGATTSTDTDVDPANPGPGFEPFSPARTAAYRSAHRVRLHTMFMAVFSALGLAWSVPALLMDRWFVAEGAFYGDSTPVVLIRLFSIPAFAFGLWGTTRKIFTGPTLVSLQFVVTSLLIGACIWYTHNSVHTLSAPTLTVVAIYLIGWMMAPTVSTTIAGSVAALQGLLFLLFTLSFAPESPPSTAALVDEILRWSTIGAIIIEVVGTRRVFQHLQDQEAEARAILAQQSLLDALTELPNRAAFMGIVPHISSQTPKEQLWLLLIDLDHFKSINDTFGHAKGDRVLQAVAGALSTNDPALELVSRIGGEEFALLLRAADAAGATAAAERVRERIAGMRVDEHAGSLTASIGVARSMADEPIRTTLRRADLALRVAKANGRNQTVLFDPTMDVHSREVPLDT